jgi:hypothetical protein
MRKISLAVVLMLMVALTGCAGWTVTGDANTQAISYGAGKGIGAAVNKYAPKADEPLSLAWSDMMTANAGADPIPADRIMAFWQQSVVLLGQQTKDPYGLISDLTMVISIYGGSVTDGKLVLAQPIPLAVAKAFELGYRSGKSAVKNYAQ